MKTNLKDNIWIEGFNSFTGLSFALVAGVKPIYSGKTSEISEELAKECVEWSEFDKDILSYYHYSKAFKTAKESIQSACDKEYCIIYKIQSICK